jgi:hypothetical protein
VPARDSIHKVVKQAIARDGWEITDDPYVISYGERFLFVDLGAVDTRGMGLIGARQGDTRIAIEIKEFRGQSQIADLEQAIGQYTLYRLLLQQVDPEREVYLAISEAIYSDIFSEPIGTLVVAELPLKLVVVDLEKKEVSQWIPSRPIKRSSSR